MNEAEFADILLKSEGPDLDFKLEPYDFFSSDPDRKLQSRGSFVKDVIALANTPRDSGAFIVFGIKKHADGRIEKAGIPEHIDDNIFQQKLEGWVFPHPRVVYHEVEFEARQYGVLEICRDQLGVGPFFPTDKSRGGEGLKPGTLYLRRGSKNSEGSPPEIHAVYNWFSGANNSALSAHFEEPIWPDFVNQAHLDEPGFRYVLFLGLSEIEPEATFAALASINWGLVVDFNPSSGTSGALKRLRPEIETRQLIHTVTRGDGQAPRHSAAVYWYMARGHEGIASTLVGPTWKDWLSQYAGDFRKRLADYAESSPSPAIIVALWDDSSLDKHLRRSLETCAEVFGETATCFVVTPKADDFRQLAEDSNATLLPLSTKNFLDGLVALSARRNRNSHDLVVLPGVSGVEKIVSAKDATWLSEDLELIHSNVGSRSATTAQLGQDFLKGGLISWFELGVGCDVDRDRTHEVLNAVRHDLQSRLGTRINLFHKPGVGGTTISRRVAWALHRDYPSVSLSRFKPRHTIERLAWIYQATEKPIFIIREGNAIDDVSADQLARELTARNISFCMLQVLRRHSLPSTAPRTGSTRSFTLESRLSAGEVARFVEVLARVVPEARSKLERLAAQGSENCSPFIFGLTAFESEFTGIESFVRNHLEGLPPIQRQALLFFALIHNYGHQALSKEHFAGLFGVPRTRPVSIQHALSDGARGLLVDIGKGEFRTLHQAIAIEVIIQVLSPLDRRAWRMQLTDSAIALAEFLSDGDHPTSEDLDDVSDRVFLFRDDADLLTTPNPSGGKFSSIVTDIPSPEGRLRLFLKLADCHPNRPHYWAHLGRFYSVELRRFDEAIKAIDRAIEIDGNDHLLHHMKGMIFRSSLYELLESKSPLNSIADLGMQASASFERARLINPDDQYGYISEVQMLIRCLDYVGSASGRPPVHASADSAEPWIREAFERIESLLDFVRQVRRGERPSDYEERCRAELDTLYGSHSDALQRWQNLLDRKDGGGRLIVFAPPIRRQIVWTHFAKAERNWERMTKKDLARCIELLHENMSEEPSNDKNVRLWLNAARHSATPASIDFALEKVAYWKSQNESVDACYYLYVLCAIQALAGSKLAVDRFRSALEETRSRARFRRDRSFSFEWYGTGEGLKRLVHQNELGDWDVEAGFWVNSDKLVRISGVVKSISGPQAGEIELDGGITAFFVPAVAGITKERDENSFISCLLGFSYDGPRAWSVSRKEN